MRALLLPLLLVMATLVVPAHSQQLDTLIDVGGYHLHFSIIEGEGMPILFEAGGAFDGLPWNGMLEPIHRATGAPIIRYDRSGFGKSELDPHATDPVDFGIENGMEELASALATLEFDNEIVLVGHSYGAFYSALYAARHPRNVQGIVLLNAQLPGYWTDERLQRQPGPDPDSISQGDFYLQTNFPQTVRTVRENPVPSHIAVIDLVAGIPIYFMTEDDFADWNEAHRLFATRHPNVQGITVHRSGHYIFKDAPIVFFNAVVRTYADAQGDERRLEVLQNAINETISLANAPGPRP